MKIGLIGRGNMARACQEVANRHNHLIQFSTGRNTPLDLLSQVDILIDFSHKDALIRNVTAAFSHKKPIVIGTTGWDDKLDEIKNLVNAHQGALFYAPNFSFGVHLFYQILKYAAQLLNHTDLYDAAAFEIHRRAKPDTPSGTALHIGNIIKEAFHRDAIVTESPQKALSSNDLHVTGVRCGHELGTHTALFSSSFDTIELTHRSCSRLGAAEGAIRAAEWLINKKGIFTLEDLFL